MQSVHECGLLDYATCSRMRIAILCNIFYECELVYGIFIEISSKAEFRLASGVALEPSKELQQGTGGAASTGVQGHIPSQGLGRWAPRKFLKNIGLLVPLRAILAIKNKETAVKSYVF